MTYQAPSTLEHIILNNVETKRSTDETSECLLSDKLRDPMVGGRVLESLVKGQIAISRHELVRSLQWSRKFSKDWKTTTMQ